MSEEVAEGLQRGRPVRKGLRPVAREAGVPFGNGR